MTPRPIPPTELTAAKFVALVDESFSVGGHGLYVLAAAVVAQGDLEQIRTQVTEAVVRRGKRPFHWVDEESADRERMIATIAALPLAHVVVVATPVAPRRQVRARALCLKHLLPSLQRRDVDHIRFESRGHQDHDDRKVIGGLRNSQIAPRTIGYSFGGKNEAALWVPDCVAGATTAARRDGQDRYLSALGDRVIFTEITESRSGPQKA